MTATYTTPAKVAAYLQRAAFSASTTPTTATVTMFIEWAQSEIERRTLYAYQAVTATDEIHTLDICGTYRSNLYDKPRIELNHFPIRTMTAATDYLYVWSGSAWVDWVATKTEGRGGDYFVDKARGIIYFLKGYPTLGYPNNIKVTYRWGESTVAPWAEELATMMAAARVLEMDIDRQISSEGGAGGSADFPRIDTTLSSLKAEIEKKLDYKKKKKAVIN